MRLLPVAGFLILLVLFIATLVNSLVSTPSMTSREVQREALLAFVPAAVRSHCAAAETERRALVTVSCPSPAPTVSRVTYSLYRSRKDLQRRARTRTAEFALPPGRCVKSPVAAGTYATPSSPNAGAMLCYRRGKQAVIEWANESLRIYATAAAPSRSRLYTWWRDAGPTASANRVPFPDEEERTVRSHVPRQFRATCGRSDFTTTGSTAAVLCSPHSGATRVFYVGFRDVSALERYYKGRMRAANVSAGSCSRSRHEPGEHAWRYGRRLCYRDRTQAIMEWTDTRPIIYAYAVREDKDLFALFSWWRYGPSGPAP
jgi:hypothetical protein